MSRRSGKNAFLTAKPSHRQHEVEGSIGDSQTTFLGGKFSSPGCDSWCAIILFYLSYKRLLPFFKAGDLVVSIVDSLEPASDTAMMRSAGIGCLRKRQNADDGSRVAEGSRRFRRSAFSSVPYWSESRPESVPQRPAAQSTERSTNDV
jgi:hypothetical protein